MSKAPEIEYNSVYSAEIDGNESQVLKLEQLGPMIINSDGTIGRITDWESKTESEKETIKRVIAARNQKRRLELEELEMNGTKKA